MTGGIKFLSGALARQVKGYNAKPDQSFKQDDAGRRPLSPKGAYHRRLQLKTD